MSAEWKQPCWNVIAEPGGPITCALTCCFPCITYGINVSKIGDAKDEVMCSGNFTSACCLYCCIAGVGCPCVVHIPTRKYIRKKYGVKAPEHGIIEDVLMTWCCSCCAIIQDYNEIGAGEGNGAGTIFSDLQSAKETATGDVKKHAKAANSAIEAFAKKDVSEEKNDGDDKGDGIKDNEDNNHDSSNNNDKNKDDTDKCPADDNKGTS
ncbi:hypothetical protein Vretimale_1414 [Volvox reticuliferus]|uniref:Uncharacterized protein n=1 Tax=Volvox reticuliferus TaxID=1737510 RepID=A0A8J4FRU7_9CHLO|nr:hypothetical protein Vretifemale_10808 [Volvox reticuliferus]GIL95370.1 hypothetical protein Vretimale_1414 [Volvox reticuliferus]